MAFSFSALLKRTCCFLTKSLKYSSFTTTLFVASVTVFIATLSNELKRKWVLTPKSDTRSKNAAKAICGAASLRAWSFLNRNWHVGKNTITTTEMTMFNRNSNEVIKVDFATLLEMKDQKDCSKKKVLVSRAVPTERQ